MNWDELDATLGDDGPRQDEAEAAELAEIIGWDCAQPWTDETGDEQ